MTDRPPRLRDELTALAQAVRDEQLGARRTLREFVRDRAGTFEHPADHRYLLRTLHETGLVGPQEQRELAAQALSLLAPVWSTAPASPYLPPAPTLPELAKIIVDGITRDQLSGLGTAFTSSQDPAHRLAQRTAKDAWHERLVAHQVAHGVAALLTAGRRDAERGAARDARRLEVYAALTRMLPALLREWDPTIEEAARLLVMLEEVGAIERVESEDGRRALEARLVEVLAAPMHERPDRVESILFADIHVSEVYASREDLAALLTTWG